MKPVRAFIAIGLPDDVKRTVTFVAGQLSANVPDGTVRWVKPNAMHLTLRFLGDTDEHLVPDLGRALDGAIGESAGFTLQLHGLGAFPNPNRPRVLWLGLRGTGPAGDTPIQALKTAVDRAIEPLGWPPEQKPFTLHLTLGRVRDGRPLGQLPWDMTVPATSFPVTAIHLIESDLRPDGPRYTIRHTVSLAATG